MALRPRVDAGNEPLAVPVRRWWTRLSSAHILIFSAGVLAFIANLAVLRPASDPPTVAIATADLLPGTVFDPEVDAEFVALSTDADVLSQLVTAEQADLANGSLVTARIPRGAPIAFSLLAANDVDSGDRLMSIPIDPERAAGGRIVAGDLIDVISSDSGESSFVAGGLQVVAVPESKSGSFGSSTGYHVVVAVDVESSLALAAALQGSTVHLVRSTGAPALTTPGGVADG